MAGAGLLHTIDEQSRTYGKRHYISLLANETTWAFEQPEQPVTGSGVLPFHPYWD